MIRSDDELLERIAQDLNWRRKELTELRSAVAEAEGALRTRVLVRSAVAILYAHWEGFIKKSSSYYLEYVAAQRIPYQNLTANFVALALKSKFRELNASKKLSSANKLAEFFCESMQQRSNIPYKAGVDTHDNLTSNVLHDLLLTLGLDSSHFETKSNFIDRNLVNSRNHVAHGQDLAFTASEYLTMHDEVLSLINTYRNLLENACADKSFRKPES